MTPGQFKAHFQQQLINTTPCSGDYLDGKSLKDAKRLFIQSRGKMTPPLVGEFHKLDVDAFFESRIKVWKKHKGQRLVYFIVDYPNPRDAEIRLKVLKAWESELDELASKYEYIETYARHMPRFIEI